MNREVEERVVAMYFDNQDFEKNAKTTIDTLGQLKEGLNLEKSAKGFDVFEKIGKSLNFEKMNQGLTKVKNGLSSMNGALGKVFKISDAPIREAESMVNTIRGYFSKVVGFDLASKVVGGIENAVRALTIQPVSAGWRQYESEMDSVKTIMSSTGESLSVVEEHLKNMTTYANKTIYSLTDMTSNLGKFTNNGVELERSVKAMEGIANATADAGQGAQQASMAMYNISQAIGVGKMTTIDWKSLENANIATTKLKNTFLEMAALHGNIEKKVEKDGSISYMLTKDENGKKLKKSVELTTANFREYLSKGWLDKETMLRTFEVYSGGVDEKTLESWGIKDYDTKKRFMELGQEALNSATQVRTFTKMMDALKESVQSGWSESFKHIFGDMEQGTELWTKLNDILDKTLSKSSENRNKILEIWAGKNTNVEGETKALEERTQALADAEKKLKGLKDKKEIEQQTKVIETYRSEIERLKKSISDKQSMPKSSIVDEQGRSGRDIAIDSLFNAIKVFKRIGSTVSGAFEGVFGKLDAKGLFTFTQKIEKAIKGIAKWLGTLKQPESRLNKIQKGLKGLLSIVKTLMNFAKIFFNLVKKIATPVADFLIDAFEKVFGFFDGLGEMSPVEVFQKIGEGISKVWEWIKGLFTKDPKTGELPVVTWIKDSWEKLKKLVKEWAEENGLIDVYNNVVKWWEDIKKGVTDAYNNLSKWWNEESGIPQFFQSIWSSIMGLFYTEHQATSDKGEVVTIIVESPIVTFFRELPEKVTEAYESVVEWWEKSTIRQFFVDMWNGIVHLFEPEKNEEGEIIGDSPIVKFFKDIKKTVDDAFEEVKTWWNGSGIPQFFKRMWNEITRWFKPQLDFVTYDDKGRHEHYKDSPIVEFFTGLWSKIETAYNGLSKWWNETSGIPQFFEQMWSDITSAFEPDKDEKGNVVGDSPIVKFFKELGGNISAAFETVQTWWKDSKIPDFFTRMWNDITKLFKPKLDFVTYDDKGRHEHYKDSPIVEFFKGIWTGIQNAYNGLSKWWNDNKVGEFFTGIWNEVEGWFKNEKEGEKTGFQKFLEDVGQGISTAWNFITTAIPWDAIGEFFTNTYNFIASLITGADEETTEAEGNTAQLKDVSQRHGGMIAAATGFVSDVSTQTRKLTDTVNDAEKDTPKKSKTQKVVDFLTGILTSIGDFFKQVIEALDGVVLPEGVSEFLKNMGDFLKGVMDVLGDVLGGAGRILSGNASATDWINVALTAFITGVLQIFQYLQTKHLAGIQVTSISQQFMQMGLGLLAMAGAISMLTLVDQDKMLVAAGVIGVLGSVIAVVIGAIQKLKSVNADEPVKSSERILTSLITTVGKIGMVATAMALLPAIIETIGKVKKDLGKDNDIGADLLNVFLGLSALILSVSLAFGAVEKLSGGKGLSVTAAAKTSFALITSLAIIVAGCGIIAGLIGGASELLGGESNADNTVKVINQGAEILAAVGGAIGGFFANMFGGGTEEQKAKQAERSIQAWAEAAEVLDLEKISGVARLMTMVRNLTEEGKSIDPGKLDGFAEAMGKLGAGIYEYANFLSGNDSIYAALSDLSDPSSDIYKRMLAFNQLGINLNELLTPFASTSFNMERALNQISLLAEKEKVDKLVEDLNKILTGLGGLNDPESGIQFDGLTIVKKLYDAIQDGLINPSLPKFDATSVVDSICEAIGLGDSAIALAVHNMVQKGLRLSGSTGEGGAGNYPTVTEDAGWLDPQLAEKLGSLGNLGSDGTLNLSGIEQQIEQLTGKDGSITKMIESIPNLGDVMDTKGWTNFTDKDGKPIDILGGLQEKMTELSSTLNETPLEVTITPVFDMKNLTAEGVQEALNKSNVPLMFNTGDMMVDFNGLSQALDIDGIKTRLDLIASNLNIGSSNQVSSINSLGYHMDFIASTIAALKLYLDTGALVGAITPMIDRQLYKEWSRP